MNDRQLIEDLLSALEYHTEQTRPIQFSTVAIEAAREYLRKPEQPAQQEPKIGCVNHDCDQCKAQQGPLAWMCHPFGDAECEFSEHQECENCIPLYTTPQAQEAPDYAWPTVQDYEADVGFKVNDAFQIGWDMARTTNDLFKQMGAAHDHAD